MPYVQTNIRKSHKYFCPVRKQKTGGIAINKDHRKLSEAELKAKEAGEENRGFFHNPIADLNHSKCSIYRVVRWLFLRTL